MTSQAKMVETCRNTVTFERFPRRWMGSDLEMFWPCKSQELWQSICGLWWWVMYDYRECVWIYVNVPVSSTGMSLWLVQDWEEQWLRWKMAIDVGEEMWLSAFQLIEVGRNVGFGGIRIKHAENCLECATAIWMPKKIERFLGWFRCTFFCF